MTEENKDTTVEAQAPAEETAEAPVVETQNEQPQSDSSAPADEPADERDEEVG